jgi:hypothetical protein
MSGPKILGLSTPPPMGAVLPEIVVLVRVKVPPFATPPLPLPLVFPEIVLFLMVDVPKREL